MAEVKNEKERGEPALSSWNARIGAALAAPALALRVSDTKAGQGRSSSDITFLLLLAILTVETELFVTAGWMVGDGDFAAALTLILIGARQHLIMPIILLLAASVVLTILAGRRRALARDFDLACVALTPLVVIELLHSLISHTGIDAHRISVVVGYAWSAVLMLLALKQARSRVLDDEAGAA